jgi:zinc protease
VKIPAQPNLAAAKSKLFFIDIPGSKQSVIYMGRPTVRGDDPRYYRMSVANNRLGAGSSARLTQTLRIAKGYTYGAYSSVRRAPYPGAFVASSQVRSNVTKASIAIFQDLLGNYAKTFGEQDLSITKNLISKGDTRRFETLGSLLRVLQTMTEYNLPKDYIQRQSAELASLTLEQLHATMGELLVMGEMTIVVVGDAATQLNGLEALGLGKPILLDRKGKRL